MKCKAAPIIWLKSGSAAGREYAPLRNGVSITRSNSGNGALPVVDDSPKAENPKKAPNSGCLFWDFGAKQSAVEDSDGV